MSNSDELEQTKVEIAWKIYEKVFVDIKSSKQRRSNEHYVGHPDRVEHDFNEMEKEHLNLLRTKLNMEIANDAKRANEEIAKKIWWLNVALVFLSFAMVIAVVFELWQ